MAVMERQIDADSKNKIAKSYRLPVDVIEAIELVASDTHQDCTWVVENILAVALGLRKMPKPLRLPKRLIAEEIA